MIVMRSPTTKCCFLAVVPSMVTSFGALGARPLVTVNADSFRSGSHEKASVGA